MLIRNLVRRAAGISRGAAITPALAITLALATALGMSTTGCKKESGPAADASKPLVVGFIFVGPKGDYGYNQAHHEGAEAARLIPGVKVLEQENVQETNDVQKVMEGMIQEDGATMVFPTSFGYFDPHMIEIAKKYPKLTFRHCGGLFTEGKHPSNTGSYFGYIDECQYIAGIVAGKTTKTKKLGFIAAKPIPQVLRNINAFTMGARSVNPEVTCSVIFTGNWAEPTKEAEAATSLIDQGADVLTCHVDSPKIVLETAEKRGIYVCGYHANGAPLAPKGYLTGSEWNWGKVYTDYIMAMKENKPIPSLVRGGLKDGFVKTSPYGPAVSEDAKKLAEAAKASAMAGQLVIFKGPLKNNKGAVVIEEGKQIAQTDPVLEKMDYLVEGVVGSAGN